MGRGEVFAFALRLHPPQRNIMHMSCSLCVCENASEFVEFRVERTAQKCYTHRNSTWM